MIYTVTFNPCLDYIVRVKGFKTGTVNRTCFEQVLPGGKGINVSFVLKNLGIGNTALGFIAGFTGQEVQKRLLAAGCSTEFIEIESGMTRINFKLKADEETEINGQGPAIKEEHIKQLYQKLSQLQTEDILVLAGSIPNTLPDRMYCDIMAYLSEKSLKIVVDATGELLVNVLEYQPFLIKPNNHELGEIFGKELKNKDEVLYYAKKMQEKGARNVLVSMAGEGAVFVGENGEEYKSEAPEGKVVNSVGAGDSMVAGFLSGYCKTGDFKEAFKTGIASGSASAFSEFLATQEEVEKIYRTLNINEIRRRFL